MRIKCSLHNHTCMSDGYFTPHGLLRYLKDEGYDVVAITDHNVVTVPHPLQRQGVEDLLLINGVEVTFPSIHIVALEPLVMNKGMVELFRSCKVGWIAHPTFSGLEPEWCRTFCKGNYLDGVELYNSGMTAKPFIDNWDLNFYAGDDLHVPSQVFTSWIEMDVRRLDKELILEKLKCGEYELFNDPKEIDFGLLEFSLTEGLK